MARMTTTQIFVAFLAAASLPAAAQAQPSGGVHIEGAGQEDHHLDCEGGPAHIEGASNRLTITGNCSSLTIEGAGNTVRVQLAPGALLRIEGASNRVTWTTTGGVRPRVSVEGAANTVQRGQ